ncbi:hypothetical protein JNM05_01725 [bacterium]|nr:hypothetical protein [bacterium]
MKSLFRAIFVTIIFSSLGLLLADQTASAQDKFYNYYDRGLNYMEKGDWNRAIEELRAAISIEFEDKKNKRTYGTRFIEYYPHRELGIALLNAGDTENAKKELDLSIAYDKTKRAQEYLGKLTGSNLILADYQTRKETEEKKTKAQEELINIELKKKEQEKAVLDEMQRGLEIQKKEQERKKLEKEKQLAEEMKRLEEDKKTKTSEEQKKKLLEDEKRLKAEKEKVDREKEILAQQKAEQDKALVSQQIILEAQQRQLEEEKEKLNREKRMLSEKRSTPNVSGLFAGALTYDPSKVTQVGSRLSIAVLPFTTKGQAANGGESVTEKMITQLVNMRRFRVIERGAIDQVIKEQNFGMSDMADEQAAVKVGKIAGADAIVLGSVNVETGFAKVSARLIDTETSETIVARDEKSDLTSTAMVEGLVEKVAVNIYNDLPLVEGFVVSVEAGLIYLDIGTLVGVRKGSKCVAYREGDPIKHPVTKEVLGKRVTKLCELVVIEVQEKLAVSKIVGKAEGDLKVGDRVVVK